MSESFRDFKEAREYVRILRLKRQYEWKAYCNSGYKPDFIPHNPEKIYKKKRWFNLSGWIDWKDWLGVNIEKSKKRKYLHFKEAKEFVHTLNLKDSNEWKVYCKSGYKPSQIPSSPNGIYKKKFEGLGDWLGNGRTRNKTYRSYKEAREFVRSLGLKSRKEWQEYCKSGNKPDDIPERPWEIYEKTRIENQKKSRVIKNSKKIIKKIQLGVSRE